MEAVQADVGSSVFRRSATPLRLHKFLKLNSNLLNMTAQEPN